MTPEEVVRAEMSAWSSLNVDQIMQYFADNATWVPGFSFPTYSGLEEIRGAVDAFVKDMTKADIEIVNLAVAGNVVLTERIDREPLGRPKPVRNAQRHRPDRGDRGHQLGHGESALCHAALDDLAQEVDRLAAQARCRPRSAPCAPRS